MGSPLNNDPLWPEAAMRWRHDRNPIDIAGRGIDSMKSDTPLSGETYLGINLGRYQLGNQLRCNHQRVNH